MRLSQLSAPMKKLVVCGKKINKNILTRENLIVKSRSMLCQCSDVLCVDNAFPVHAVWGIASAPSIRGMGAGLASIAFRISKSPPLLDEVTLLLVMLTLLIALLC